MADIPPNQTLYIKNLNSRINVLELKASLYNLFASYGHIVDVKAQSTEKLREQAFVAFVDVTSATTAMRSLEGFVFYDKPLIITYAKNKSDAVALLDGTFKLRTKPTSSANTTALGKRNNDDATDQPSKQTKMDSDGDDSE